MPILTDADAIAAGFPNLATYRMAARREAAERRTAEFQSRRAKIDAARAERLGYVAPQGQQQSDLRAKAESPAE